MKKIRKIRILDLCHGPVNADRSGSTCRGLPRTTNGHGGHSSRGVVPAEKGAASETPSESSDKEILAPHSDNIGARASRRETPMAFLEQENPEPGALPAR